MSDFCGRDEDMWMSDYALALSLTLVIELAVAVLFGLRSRLAISLIVLVNLTGHPILSYLLWINRYFAL